MIRLATRRSSQLRRKPSLSLRSGVKIRERKLEVERARVAMNALIRRFGPDAEKIRRAYLKFCERRDRGLIPPKKIARIDDRIRKWDEKFTGAQRRLSKSQWALWRAKMLDKLIGFIST